MEVKVVPALNLENKDFPAFRLKCEGGSPKDSLSPAIYFYVLEKKGGYVLIKEDSSRGNQREVLDLGTDLDVAKKHSLCRSKKR